jgi:hypothetical protein
MAMNKIDLRIEDELADRLDRAATLLSKRVPGVKVTRSDAVRAAIEAGLVIIEGDEKKSKR